MSEWFPVKEFRQRDPKQRFAQQEFKRELHRNYPEKYKRCAGERCPKWAEDNKDYCRVCAIAERDLEMLHDLAQRDLPPLQCVEWEGRWTKKLGPTIRLPGFTDRGNRRYDKVARVMLEIFTNEYCGGCHIVNTCDNPKCVNPHHHHWKV